MRNERRIVTVSTVIDGNFGLKNVAISLPSVVSSQGVEEIIDVEMDDNEKEKFLQSAQVLKEAIAEVQ